MTMKRKHSGSASPEKQLQRRADRLVERANAALALGLNEYWADQAIATEVRELGLALIADLYGEHHRMWKSFEAATSSHNMDHIRKAIGIASALQTLLSDDWLTKTKTLLSAELFDDFLDMAEHLLTENYKDAAAVITGSSLEAHLRKVATARGVAVTYADRKGAIQPKSADLLNADLVKAGAYDRTPQKQVTAWLAIRNHAAHGEYDKVDAEQVRLMVMGLRTFMKAYPA